jgi:hypothetical protein
MHAIVVACVKHFRDGGAVQETMSLLLYPIQQTVMFLLFWGANRIDSSLWIGRFVAYGTPIIFILGANPFF